MLSKIFICVLLACAANARTTFSTEKNIIHNGYPSPLLEFQIKATDTEKNVTWICNRVQFALSMDFLYGDNATYSQINLNNKTVVNEDVSTCDSLTLFFNGFDEKAEYPEILKLDFLQEEGFNDNGDSEFIYLSEVKIEHISYAETREATTTFDFVEQQAKNENNTNTPIEFDPVEYSFKCYNGFSMAYNSTEYSVEVKFSQFRHQYSKTASSDDAVNSGKTWKRVFSCDNDISSILPIIVGVVLTLIIILTIVGYFVAKKRSSHAYEELTQ